MKGEYPTHFILIFTEVKVLLMIWSYLIRTRPIMYIARQAPEVHRHAQSWASWGLKRRTTFWAVLANGPVRWKTFKNINQMKRILIILSIALSFSAISCKDESKGEIKLVTPLEMQTLLESEDVQLVDVRTP